MYSAPGFDEARAEAREAAQSGRSRETSVPIEDIVPDWPERVAAARSRREL
jgi:ribosome-binding protein aMBF1 (putative translation factor)